MNLFSKTCVTYYLQITIQNYYSLSLKAIIPDATDTRVAVATSDIEGHFGEASKIRQRK